MPIKRPRQVWGWDTTNTEHVKLAVDSNGRLITSDILCQYQISNHDASEPAYWGYLRDDGYYYIMKVATSGNEKTYTYSSGTSGYSTAWTNRTTQTYRDFATEF